MNNESRGSTAGQHCPLEVSVPMQNQVLRTYNMSGMDPSHYYRTQNLFDPAGLVSTRNYLS